MLRLRLVVGKVVRSLGCGGGYTSSTRQRGVSIMGEFMSTNKQTMAFPCENVANGDHFFPDFFF